MNSATIGSQTEDIAAAYLQQHSLAILQRNFRCKFGEIDIIGQHDADLVFVEVRYRKHDAFGSAAESVTLNKQQKLIRSAEYYLQNNSHTTTMNCRFDVIAISDLTKPTQIEWIKDAFNA